MMFASFLESLSDRQKARELYYYLGKKYAKWLGIDIGSLGKEHFSEANVRSFLSTISNSYTANAFISMCRSFAKYVRYSMEHRSVEDLLDADRFYSSMRMIRFRETPFYVRSSAVTVDQLKMLIRLAGYPLDAAVVVHFFFGARPSELARKYVKGSIRFDRYEECIVDFRKKLIAIPNAKRKGVSRILPFDGIEEYVKDWIEICDEAEEYYRPRAWFTERIRFLGKKLGIKVTAKTARKTFETEMTRRGAEEWELRYWLGHKTEISDVYRDYVILMDKLREDIVSKHYIFEALA